MELGHPEGKAENQSLLMFPNVYLMRQQRPDVCVCVGVCVWMCVCVCGVCVCVCVCVCV